MIRTTLALSLVGMLLGACTMNSSLGSGGQKADASGSGGTAGASSSGGSTGTAGASSGGASCVSVNLSSYDTSCNQASDCTYIQVGQVCTGQCACGNAVINASGLPQYQHATSSVHPGMCFCPASRVPQCVQHQCVIPPPDAGTSDGGACVNVDLSSYDTSCNQASDCTAISTGQICTGGCACDNALINASALPQYQQATSSVHPLACSCPAFPLAQCIQHKCVIPTLDAGTSDGG